MCQLHNQWWPYMLVAAAALLQFTFSFFVFCFPRLPTGKSSQISKKWARSINEPSRICQLGVCVKLSNSLFFTVWCAAKAFITGIDIKGKECIFLISTLAPMNGAQWAAFWVAAFFNPGPGSLVTSKPNVILTYEPQRKLLLPSSHSDGEQRASGPLAHIHHPKPLLSGAYFLRALPLNILIVLIWCPEAPVKRTVWGFWS